MTAAPHQSGFSLIEMMAALAVVSVAGLALMNATQATTRNTAAVQDRALAMLAAENILNAQLAGSGRLQSRSGDYDLAGIAYDWNLTVSTTDDADLLRLHLVLRKDGSGRVAAEIDTFRRARS
ncbi:type II secretion system minor pseudopilin GspI [Maricaulis sp.]|uniref:type II secretion system minor pseudopilin GspI n=1 Tax=Maricaulis sp. TaxID=1486257 RepID=UPI0026311C6B|nr:type II secretion system minor pseudopilin GspI [Maricaulis sp.]